MSSNSQKAEVKALLIKAFDLGFDCAENRVYGRDFTKELAAMLNEANTLLSGPADSVECIFCKGRGWMEKRKPSTIIDSEPAQAHNYAPEGKLWQCGACGKTTKDQYGEEGGWDESCMLNSFLIDAPRPDATEDDGK